MQQTEKRAFNIIETSDPFSPDALNANTRKIEAALDAHETAVAARMDALDQRIQAFEAKKFAYGDFAIGDETLHIALGFAPRLVFIHRVYFPGAISYMIADSVSAQGGRCGSRRTASTAAYTTESIIGADNTYTLPSAEDGKKPPGKSRGAFFLL